LRRRRMNDEVEIDEICYDKSLEIKINLADS
jgi:hypothetical protein